GERLTDQLDYWRRQLAGAPPVLELPTDRPRPVIPSNAGASYRQELPAELAEAMQALARAGDATLFMALGAAFTALLGRLSGQDDIVLGTPIAGRTDPALEPLIGFFVNTLALRTDLSGDPGFATLLARTRETTLAAYQHQDLPFEYLVEHLALARDPGRNPLFQVMFTVVHDPPAERELPGLRLAAGELETGVAKFDLTLTIAHRPDRGLEARWEYRRDLFDEPTVARIAGYYHTLLESILAAPDRPLSTLALLPDEEWLERVDQPAPPGPARFVPDLIAERAASRPAAIALVAENLSLTYAELDGRAAALAARLRDRGVGPDVLVGVCARRGPELIIGLLAVLRAGGAYLPLDPDYPAARTARILADARPALLLTQRGLLDGEPGAILLDEPVSGPARPVPAPRLRPEHLAYVIYTSGSTGTPKGVAVSHANLAASTAARMAVYDRPVRGLVLLSSVAFDTSIASIFWSLCAGATLHLPAEGRQLGLDHLAGLVNRPDVSHLVCLPSLYQLLATKPIRLDTVVVAGEPVPPGLVDAHHAALPEVPLYNEYGPTEAAVWSTVALCRPGERRVPIGRPIPGWQAYILDRHNEPVPVGVTGELYLAGNGIARGYLGRPALTAQRFLPNPYGPPGSRMYRTGDLARYRPDGQIDFVGRTDHQVKIRGYRIELDEIDGVLLRHPDVRAAVTVATDGTLVSYVVGAPADLRDYLSEQLPAWMRPAQVVELAELPRTPNGKVDRAALPAARPAIRS
ncbi:MAG TPA: amino acid adenylation domain-containing protein, partial [Micromonosporaceae bacterium]|nr:amino acid adenylation domain-containing protein [Micromonosporaceae bacterium]